MQVCIAEVDLVRKALIGVGRVFDRTEERQKAMATSDLDRLTFDNGVEFI
jgi:hypothetical protein